MVDVYTPRDRTVSSLSNITLLWTDINNTLIDGYNTLIDGLIWRSLLFSLTDGMAENHSFFKWPCALCLENHFCAAFARHSVLQLFRCGFNSEKGMHSSEVVPSKALIFFATIPCTENKREVLLLQLKSVNHVCMATVYLGWDSFFSSACTPDW